MSFVPKPSQVFSPPFFFEIAREQRKATLAPALSDAACSSSEIHRTSWSASACAMAIVRRESGSAEAPRRGAWRAFR